MGFKPTIPLVIAPHCFRMLFTASQTCFQIRQNHKKMLTVIFGEIRFYSIHVPTSSFEVIEIFCRKTSQYSIQPRRTSREKYYFLNYDY
jgi:hypothetical protein